MQATAQYTYIARVSNHIAQDIERGWSSWNYGKEGVTQSQVDAFLDADDQLEEYERDQDVIYISTYSYTASQLRRALECGDVDSLYEGYLVARDNQNGCGLACNILPVSSEKEAREYVQADGFRMEMGAGDFVDVYGGFVVAEFPYNHEGNLYIIAVPNA